MDFLTLLKIMFRRWFVVIPVLAATAALGVVFIGEPEVRYASSGSELLVIDVSDQPEPEPDTTSPQPLSTSTASGILVSALDLQSYRGDLTARDLIGDYAIEADPAVSVLTITVASDDEAQVVETGETIVAEAQSVLDSGVGADQAENFRVAPVATVDAGNVVTFNDAKVLRFALVVLPVPPPVPPLPVQVLVSPFPPSLLTARTLSEVSQRPQVLSAVRQVAPTTVYGVSTVERDAAPIINIALESSDPAELEPAYRALVEALNLELSELQLTAGGDAAADQTVLATLVPPTQIQQTTSSIVRSAAGFALLGFAVACGLAILVDSLILRRRAKKLVLADVASERQATVESDPTPALGADMAAGLEPVAGLDADLERRVEQEKLRASVE